MRRKIHKCLSFLLAAVLLASLAAPAALAAEGGDTVFVRTAEGLVQLAENCTLDSWSQGKTVCLEADIDLSGTDFTPIPTFGGTFEGQGHTISGLSITGSGNVRGLFRYIQPSGVVRDLSVEGRVDPSDRKNTLGGIAGSNRGLLAGCTFHGTVRGADSIGGLVGINESSGQIVNCTFSGAVTGEHYAGGIAGQNYGAVIQCRNSGSINTTEVDAELDLDAINREQLNAAENVPVCTDVGGVAGYSSGIIQSCTNSGSVGYDHVGYNIGGIVGRQSGYLDGCANSGDILGRKDVGGVAGQLEPEVRLLYDQGQMGELLDALDGLGDLLDQTQQDLRGTSDALSDRMDAISARTDEAREAVGDLADSAADWTNENIEELNSLTARISWLIDQLAPILDDAVDVMDLVEDLADELGNALDEVGAASGLGDQAEQELRDLLEQTGEELSDRFEDISDQETSGPDTGCVANSRNTGTVEGDINVAGIVGSMAIEYDFDPEDDLIEEGDRSLDFRYQTKAVVRACMNRGGVTGKRDYAGGVVGLMDLGRVSGCENYGDIASTDGGYVGGIAGASWGTIRDSWVKCHLSGGDYIGGVAGLGATLENCHTLVEIEEGSAYLGAVAGDVDADAAVSDNTFTSERLGALDGISYAGHAEPVDFDTLCTTPGVPESFSRLELTFVADGVVVEVVPFQYGEGIDALPEIPAKKGCSASWPDLDYTCLTASQTLEAEYTPYTSALTDGGELPEILVDGSFSSRAQVSHTTEEVAWTDGGAEYAGTAYTVTVEDPDLEQAAYTVHCRLPDPGKRYDLWVLSEDGWTKTDARLDGQYLLLESQTGTVTFCLTERAGPLAVVILAVGFAGLLIGFCWLIRWRRKGTAAGRKH